MDTNEFLSGGQKTPSISLKDREVGWSFEGTVAREARTMQSRDYDTGDLEWWDSPTNSQPKMQMAVYLDTGVVHPDPTEYPDHDGVWAWYVRQSTQPHKELREAIRKAGAKGLDIGGRVKVTYIGEGEHTDPIKAKKYKKPKHVQVIYTPPAARATQDFLGGNGGGYGSSDRAESYRDQRAVRPGQAPAGLDPTAWANLDESRRAAILAQMSQPAGAGNTPPF